MKWFDAGKRIYLIQSIIIIIILNLKKIIYIYLINNTIDYKYYSFYNQK